MIGLDTNVLVRYLAQDDENQSPCLIETIALAQGCTHTVIFDKAAAKLPGMRRLIR